MFSTVLHVVFLDWLANGSIRYGLQCWGTCMCVNFYMHWANSHQTGAETLHLQPPHHLHRLFPACRVIPAPVLPPLPSHTYQSPAAVPLPESGSSSLENLEERQQPVLLALFFLFSLTLTISLPFLWYSVNWKIHLISFPSDNNLLNCEFLCFIFKAHLHEISALACFCLSALLGCYLTSIKTAIVFQRQVG